MVDPILRNSDVVYDFLSIDDDAKFLERKKYYHNLKLPTNLKEYKSPDGVLDIELNEDKEMTYKSVKDNTELNITLLSKLNNNSASFSNKHFNELYPKYNLR